MFSKAVLTRANVKHDELCEMLRRILLTIWSFSEMSIAYGSWIWFTIVFGLRSDLYCGFILVPHFGVIYKLISISMVAYQELNSQLVLLYGSF